MKLILPSTGSGHANPAHIFLILFYCPWISVSSKSIQKCATRYRYAYFCSCGNLKTAIRFLFYIWHFMRFLEIVSSEFQTRIDPLNLQKVTVEVLSSEMFKLESRTVPDINSIPILFKHPLISSPYPNKHPTPII